jgi:transposase-like protein
VPVPAYEALKANDCTGARMLEILLSGVSTRHYAKVLPEMAESVGISRSAVSREFIAASEDELKALCERRLEGVEILIIIDGIRFGEQQVIVALGVDPKGQQHLLGLREGATENATVATELLEDLVARGLDPRQRLFVIDGSKALRAAINRVFGERVAVQRCRNHKLRSVLDYLPKELKPQVASVMRAALGLGAEQGIAKLKQQAQWLERG